MNIKFYKQSTVVVFVLALVIQCYALHNCISNSKWIDILFMRIKLIQMTHSRNNNQRRNKRTHKQTTCCVLRYLGIWRILRPWRPWSTSRGTSSPTSFACSDEGQLKNMNIKQAINKHKAIFKIIFNLKKSLMRLKQLQIIARFSFANIWKRRIKQ